MGLFNLLIKIYVLKYLSNLYTKSFLQENVTFLYGIITLLILFVYAGVCYKQTLYMVIKLSAYNFRM